MNQIHHVAFAICFVATALIARPETFQNPINSGPDPYLDFFDGNYYLTTPQGDCIRMWKSKTLGGLKTARPVVVWRDNDPSRSARGIGSRASSERQRGLIPQAERGIWAPEFHFITNHWYLYYTATSSDNSDANHRLHVLESAGADPLGPYVYKGRLINPTNDNYAIDATVFKNPGDGLWCAVWAARPGHVLTLAQLANPWTVRGTAVVIPASGFGCEEVRESPQVLAHNDAAGVFGPGPNGFFKAADGSDWIVYHAKTTAQYTYRGRTTRVQPFTWNADGLPNFGQPLPLSAVLSEPRAK